MFYDGPSVRPVQPGLPPPQINNPTPLERYALARYALNQAGRPEDFDNIIRLLSPPPPITSIAPPGAFKGVKVGVIGGGIAGLCAAFELRKLGYDITLFEALKDRIGGRIFTYYFDKEKNLYGELGAMRTPVTHETTWSFINLFNLNTRPYIQTNENAFIYVHNTRVRNDEKGQEVMEKIYPKFALKPWERKTPWSDLLDYALETPLLSMPSSVRAELLKVLPKYSPQIIYWDYHNIRQVMEMAGLSQDAIYMLSSISPFTGAFLYYSFIEVLKGSNPIDFTFLYEVIGGMVKLPLAFYHSLLSPSPSVYKNIPYPALGHVTMRTGTWVDGIFLNPQNGKVKLRFNSDMIKTHAVEEFDYVVCAIPFSTLRNVEIYPAFSNRKMQAIREVGYSASQKTLLLCEERFWEKGGPKERIIGGGSFTDLPIASIWYPSDHGKCYRVEKDYYRKGYYQSPLDKWYLKEGCSPLDPGVLLASYNFTLDAIRLGNAYDPLRFESIKRQVELVHGLPRNYLDTIVEDYVSFNWNEAPWSLGGFSYFLPEQKRLFSYAMNLPEYGGKVFFAGEHLSSSHGWQNGALQTAMVAANNIALASKTLKNR